MSDWKTWPLSDSTGCAALCLPVPFSPLGDSTWGELYLVTLGTGDALISKQGFSIQCVQETINGGKQPPRLQGCSEHVYLINQQ